MTTVKKVVPVKKTTKGPIITYKIDNSACSLSDMEEFEFDTEPIRCELFVDNTNIFTFYVSCFNNCCGALEIGSFILRKAVKKEELTLAAAFIQVVVDSKTSSKFKTVSLLQNSFVTTTNQKQTDIVEIIKKSNRFTEVKQFANSNSGNIVTLWVSHN